MEAKVMIAGEEETKGERERDVANRHFCATAHARLKADEEINYLPAILCDVTYFLITP
jgi:hypothetical protein